PFRPRVTTEVRHARLDLDGGAHEALEHERVDASHRGNLLAVRCQPGACVVCRVIHDDFGDEGCVRVLPADSGEDEAGVHQLCSRAMAALTRDAAVGSSVVAATFISSLMARWRLLALSKT